MRWAAALGADRIELYTEPFARAFAARRPRTRRKASRSTPRPRRWRTASALGINAGHDLDLDNLTLFRTLPHLDEVSIGHALISHALCTSASRQAVKDYLAVSRV